MIRPWLRWVVLPTFLIAAVRVAGAQSHLASDESFFIEKLYPVMHAVQCNLCHNDNGVASGTELEFPGEDASREQVTAFGLSLMDLIDRDDPEQSLLFLMPTNREEHTGGERIKPGSDEEIVLLSWINYLAGLSEEQVRQTRKRIQRAQQLDGAPADAQPVQPHRPRPVGRS